MLTIFRILLGLAVVAGVGLGSFYLVRASQHTTPEQAIVESPTATATPLPTDTPEPAPTAAPPSPTAVPPSPTAEAAAPTALPTKIPLQARRDVPTVAEIMVDANGKYFIPDRGDGCPWFEFSRVVAPVPGKTDESWTEVNLYTPCDSGGIFWPYRVETGEVFAASP